MKVAKERKSAVLASNAVHHRIDSLTSIVALLTIGGAHVLTDASWLDPVGGLIISLMIIKAGWNNTMSALLELGDVSVDDDIKDSVGRSTRRALLGKAIRGVPGVPFGDQVEIRDIQGVKSGQNYLMDIDLAVPSTLTVAQIGAIEAAVRERVGLKVRGVRKVRVKFSPVEENRDFDSEFVPPDVNPLGNPEPQEDHDHDHSHNHANGHNHEAHQKKTI